MNSVVNDDKDSTHHAGRDLPSIAIFTGQDFSKNSTFQQWKFEIDCLKHEDNLFSESQIRYIVRRSLKGEAGTIAERLGPKASLTELLDCYGVTSGGEEALAEFNAASQKPDESVVSWAIRLETLYNHIKKQGLAAEKEKSSQLRLRYWLGLLLDLREGSWHIFDSTEQLIDLKCKMRLVESGKKRETDKPSASGQTKSLSVSAKYVNYIDALLTEMKEIRVDNNKLVTKVARLEKRFNNKPPLPPPGDRNVNTYIAPAPKYRAPHTFSPTSPFQMQRHEGAGSIPTQNPGANYAKPRFNNGPTNAISYPQVQHGRNNNTPQPPTPQQVQCWNCQGFGHYRRNCTYQNAITCYNCGFAGNYTTSCPWRDLN